MIDMIDNMFWLYLLGATGILYALNWLVSTRRARKVYRISEDSLKVSKQVMLKVLPLVEEEGEDSLDIATLSISKDSVKSAAKILAYFYLKGEKQDDYIRVRNCFIALSRFQNQELKPKSIKRCMAREKRRLTREFNGYIARSPFCDSNVCPADVEETVEAIEAETVQPRRKGKGKRAT